MTVQFFTEKQFKNIPGLNIDYGALPLLIITVLMVLGKSPGYSAFWATLSCIAVSWVRKETRMGPREIWEAIQTGARNTLIIGATVGVIGIIVGTISLSGIGLKFSDIIISLSGGFLPVAILLIGIASLASIPGFAPAVAALLLMGAVVLARQSGARVTHLVLGALGVVVLAGLAVAGAGEVAGHHAGHHEVAVGQALHQGAGAQTVGAVVGEVGLAGHEETVDGRHQVVVHPEPAHRVVERREDPHRNLVGVLVRDAEVHVEEVAVALLDRVSAEAADGVGEGADMGVAVNGGQGHRPEHALPRPAAARHDPPVRGPAALPDPAPWV